MCPEGCCRIFNSALSRKKQKYKNILTYKWYINNCILILQVMRLSATLAGDWLVIQEEGKWNGTPI